MQLTRRQRPEYWSPLTRLQDELNRFFTYPDLGETEFFGNWLPAVDIREDKDKLVVKAEIPGMKKEDINVSVHENTLVLSGEKKCEEEEKNGETYRSERCYGRFQRSIALPWSVDTGKIDAQYRDGVLTVMLPKSEQAKPKQIDVKVA
jgi:HSP20 family protein